MEMVGDDISLPFGRHAANAMRLARAALPPQRHSGPTAIARSTFNSEGGPTTAIIVSHPGRLEVRLRIVPAAGQDGVDDDWTPGADDRIQFSVVTPVYNVARYLPDYLHSVTGQSLPFSERIELILVDDGSTDDSPKIMRRWQNRFPRNIRYLRKPNGGLSSARNFGLAHARHEWITFADPDDFLSPDYFAEVENAIRRHGEARLAMVSCNFIPYIEETRELRDNHPLRYRYDQSETLVGATALGRNIQLSVNNLFLRRSLLSAGGLTFDGRIRPSFEDGHLVSRYLAGADGRSALFLRKPRYFYRRRADQSSLVDKSRLNPNWYGDQLRYGCLELLREMKAAYGQVPEQVVNTVIYEVSWRLSHVVDKPNSVAFLTEAQRTEFFDLMRDIFGSIDADAIMRYDIYRMPLHHRIGILALFKQARPPAQAVRASAFDRGRRLLQFIYWSDVPTPTVTFRSDDRVLAPAFGKSRRHDFMGHPFCWQHRIWLPAENGQLSANDGERPALIHLGEGGAAHTSIATDEIEAYFTPASVSEKGLAPRATELRMLARSPAVAASFQQLWLLMDRDTEADDNAEHFYRYLRRDRPEINTAFVLRRNAPDWTRLELDGFRLIPFGSAEHAAALLNARFYISSHADRYVFDSLPGAYFRDMLHYKFVFLQHGIVKDDLSGWLNGKPIDCFVTSTMQEYRSIVADGSTYEYSGKQVVLTGLPRHDSLLRAGGHDGHMIVIMPTWRKSLTGQQIEGTNLRARNNAFYKSDFARQWRSLLHSERLRAAADAAGRKVVFLPHKNIEPYIDFFDPPSWVELRRFGGDQSIQALFRDVAFFVTDYSSVSFDIAYLDKPLAYYQFDREFAYAGGHQTMPGYFDYARDGYGPICEDEESLLQTIESFLRGERPSPIYRERSARTFLFRDGKCCERVYEAILRLDRPYQAVAQEHQRLSA
jgi:glycosyltransferase involved in cell wall biosynthesis